MDEHRISGCCRAKIYTWRLNQEELRYVCNKCDQICEPIPVLEEKFIEF